MNIFSWVGQRIGLSGDSAKRFWASFAGAGTSNERVTADSAMGVMAFWRGIRLSAETVGTLPPSIYKLAAGSNDGVIDRDNPYDALVRVSPNQDQTAVEFWESMIGAMMLVGNGYALKQRIAGRVVALEPMIADPAFSYPWRDANKYLWYKLRDFQGRDYPKVDPKDVFHLKGFGFGGDCGLSALQYGAQALGMAQAGNRVASRTFATGLASSGFLETGQVLNEEDRPRLEKIMADYQSTNSPGKIMILEGGMKFNKLSMTSVDAELLSTMGYSIEEIGRLLGIPPILLGHSSDGQTMWGTGVESIVQAWYTLGLRAIITRTEKAFIKRVIEPGDQSKYYLKFNVEGLLRGDSETQARIAASLVQNGLANRDEQRALWDKPPIPDGSGKVFTAQVNLTPLGKLGVAGTASTDPAAQIENAVQNLRAEFEGFLAEMRRGGH